MSTPVLKPTRDEVVYPSNDGNPMSDNTLQFRWIVTIKENLEFLFADDPDVFVAGDLLWYPVEKKPGISAAPDTMVAFGRPKGERSSYLQWEEGNIAPQVVFEILSPSNRPAEMAQKFAFYETHGVEEYYLYDPDSNRLAGWRRAGRKLRPISAMHGWTSPRLGVRFECDGDEPRLIGPDGKPFDTMVEIARERQRKERENERLLREKRQAERRIKKMAQENEQLAKELEALRAKLKGDAGA